MFATALHESVDRAKDALQQAETAGPSSETHRHAARVLDLLDRARMNGVDTTDWVPAPLLRTATASAGFAP